MIGGSKMKYCNSCKRLLSSDYYKYCPYCGSKFDSVNEFDNEKNYELAKKHYCGNGVKKNYKNAVKYYTKAARNGHPKA